MITASVFVVALLCASLMGFAIQRGATCTVAAMDELVRRRKASRLSALIEASIWVAGGLIVAHHLGWVGQMPIGHPASWWTVAGAALLGLGAYVNRACVFGAIARLGSGEWAYLATPLGFYIGCQSVAPLLAAAAPQSSNSTSFVFTESGWTLLPVLAFVVWRLGRSIVAVLGTPPKSARDSLFSRTWTPRAATAVIGLTFLVMLLTLGAWAYTDVLADLARGMAENLLVRTALFASLLIGAVLGGWLSGRIGRFRFDATDVVRCLCGGLLMSWGSLLIPGGNDGLILVSMPLLWPYAWLAFGVMCVSIGAALVLEDRWVNAGDRVPAEPP